MADRVVIGSIGGTFMLRVSKPGYHAYAAPPDGLAFHENLRPMVPVVTGYLWVPPGAPANQDNRTNGQASVSLGMGFSFPPKIIIHSNQNRISVESLLNMDTGVLTIYNDAFAAALCRYFVFMPF